MPDHQPLALPPLPPLTRTVAWSGFTADDMHAYARPLVTRIAELERALTKISATMSSDWPERCIENVRIARAVMLPKDEE